MQVVVESGVHEDPLEQGDEGVRLVRLQPAEQPGLEVVDQGLGLGVQAAAGREYVDGVGAAVGGMAAALHQAALLHLVDQADHHVAVHVQRPGELVLTEAVLLDQQVEQAELAGWMPSGASTSTSCSCT
ncbi:hypothetical protein SAV31267_001480 [Streptomyces avermitilis]|uniref:Uncharacterized protein n=1 Tax=Streptomyces avermitilis TaxID=33903 RepID=A0A4D4MFC5_STRAX|nr:hypothetical protein SAV31267_001480 [Streptomyces avermitilis]